MNKVILIGNLTRDIETKIMPNGNMVATTGIATSRKFRKQDGSQGEEVMFIDLTFFAKSAEIASQYLTRGSKISVEGSLKLDSWDDKNGGGKRSKHTVTVERMEMLDAKQDGQKQPVKVEVHQQGQKVAEYDMPSFDVDSDEIPFNGGIR